MIEIAPWVRDSLASGRPVVALETAVVTHGLPRPVNLEAYEEMGAAVRAAGAAPAPVGVVEGRVRVGLAPEEIRRLAEGPAEKAGLADLPALAARGASAGTTVAATLWAAHRAGIRVFATGGIGGVHRGWNRLPDVSGDLPALARFPLCVVCSGAKVVLDLAATREALETAGVPVVGYRTDRFPAFVCADAGFPVRYRAEGPGEVARVVQCRDGLGLSTAVLVVNPPPAGHAMPREVVEGVLADAGGGEGGGEVTPHLLSGLAEATEGATLAANRALLVANAGLAAEIARHLSGA
ncbi:pseudouridine-5'-phosphate glycosidase [Deferrisoma palaeochoriense]